jgi:uncharacterized membrane protein
MENNYNKVAKIANEGYDLDFGLVFEKSFDNFKKIWGIAGVALLLVSIVFGAFMVAIFGIIYGFSNYTETLVGLNPEFMTSTTLIGFIVFSTVFAGLFSPINAGFIKMAYLADTNQPFGINTVFDYFKTSHFKELFISSSAITLVGTGIGYVIEFAGVPILGNIITYLVSFLTILTIPLIIFSDLKAFEGITMSIKLVLKKPFILLALLIVAILIVVIGIFALCIGILFTAPFLFSLYYIIYKNVIPLENKDELDEIGKFE